MEYNYRNKLGHIIKENLNLHVCGYTHDGMVWVQSGAGQPRKLYTTYENSKGIYFNYNGKRMYLYKK